jgi:class 3 adenylate cyclase
MILGISDAKGLTGHISLLLNEGRPDEVSELYRRLFVSHHRSLGTFPSCCWKLIKTTGDGAMFFSNEKPTKEHLQSLPALQTEIRDHVGEDNQITARVLACYIESSDIVHAHQICAQADHGSMDWLANDLFGHRLNIAFRLLSAVTSDAAVVADDLLSRIFPDEANGKRSFDKTEAGLGFRGPVPITSLKGIDDIGFSAGQTRAKRPSWLWEIITK